MDDFPHTKNISNVTSYGFEVGGNKSLKSIKKQQKKMIVDNFVRKYRGKGEEKNPLT